MEGAMGNQRFILGALIAVLFCGVALPSFALDLGIGGGSASTDTGDGGATASASGGDSNFTIAIGGGESNVFSGSGGTGNGANETGYASISRQDGALATVGRGDGSTAGNINLCGAGGGGGPEKRDGRFAGGARGPGG